jgi:hypothetical protein
LAVEDAFVFVVAIVSGASGPAKQSAIAVQVAHVDTRAHADWRALFGEALTVSEACRPRLSLGLLTAFSVAPKPGRTQGVAGRIVRAARRIAAVIALATAATIAELIHGEAAIALAVTYLGRKNALFA